MKKLLGIVLSVVFSMSFLMGCSNRSLPEEETAAQKIYAQAQSLGFEGSLDEFLAICKGEQGLPGADGREVELRVNGDMLQWRYTGESIWKDLISFGQNVEKLYTVTFVDVGETFAVQKTASYCKDMPLPTRNSNTFQGWYTGFSINDAKLTALTPILDDLTVYAKWASPVKTEDEIIDSLYPYARNLGYLENLESFRALCKGEDGIPELERKDVVLRKVIGVLQWAYEGSDIWSDLYLFDKNAKFTVTLKDGEKTVGIRKTDALCAFLPMPCRRGNEFLGWFSAKEGGTRFTSQTVVNEDKTVYARWKRTPGTEAEPVPYDGWEKPDAVKAEIDSSVALNVIIALNSAEQSAIFQSLGKDYSQANPSVSVNSQYVGSGVDYFDYIYSPNCDLVYLGYDSMDPINFQEYFVPLEEIRAVEPTYLGNLTFGGNDGFSLSTMRSDIVTFYNSSKTDAAQLSTWEGLKSIYAGKDGYALTVCNTANLPHNIMSPLLADELGLDVYQSIGLKTIWSDEADHDIANGKISKEKFESAMYRIVLRMRELGFVQSESFGNQNETKFYDGTAAYFVDGPWRIGALETAQKESEIDGLYAPGVTAFPKVKASENSDVMKSVRYGSTLGKWYIKKSVANQGPNAMKAAIAYVKQMTSDWAVNALCVESKMYLPATNLPLKGAGLLHTLSQEALSSCENFTTEFYNQIPIDARYYFISNFSTDFGIAKLLYQTAAPTMSEVHALFVKSFYPHYSPAQGGTGR